MLNINKSYVTNGNWKSELKELIIKFKFIIKAKTMKNSI